MCDHKTNYNELTNINYLRLIINNISHYHTNDNNKILILNYLNTKDINLQWNNNVGGIEWAG